MASKIQRLQNSVEDKSHSGYSVKFNNKTLANLVEEEPEIIDETFRET